MLEQDITSLHSATIGCDLSSSTVYLGVTDGYQVVNCGSVATAATGDADDRRRAFLLLKQLLHEIREMHAARTRIYIEQPWIRPIKGQSPLASLLLARTATLVEIASLELGLDTTFVLPMSWRKKVLGTGRPETPKEAAVDFIKEKFGYDVPVLGKTGRGKTPDHNFAEALCISHYGWLEESMNPGKSR